MNHSRTNSAPVIRLARMGLVSLAALAVAAAIGAFPTFRLAGPAGLQAMALGGAVALLATLVGLVPPLLMYTSATQRPVGLLLGTAMRALAMLALLLAAALSDIVPIKPLIIWAGIAYMVLLVVDTTVLVRSERQAEARP